MAIELDVDPFQLAQDMQRQIMDLPFDKRVEIASNSLEFLGRSALELHALSAMFIVDCRTAFARPKQPYSPKQKLVYFGDVAMEGTLVDFVYLSIGKLDRNPVNSLSAAFADVTMLPGLETLPNGDVMYVPVLAIDQTLRTN